MENNNLLKSYYYSHLFNTAAKATFYYQIQVNVIDGQFDQWSH